MAVYPAAICGRRLSSRCRHGAYSNPESTADGLLERSAKSILTGQSGVTSIATTSSPDVSGLAPREASVPRQIARANNQRALPRATYRLQFHPEFTFDDATELVPYLRDLGISHLYASPLFRAVPGSMHGYDVIDQNELKPEIGTRADFNRLVSTLHRHGLKLIVDIVPNHMGIANGFNRWW